MKMISTTLIFALLISLTSFADQAPYERIVAFGDSLTDGGTYSQAASNAGGGKYTTNPGQIWIEVVAEKLNLKIQPNRFEGFQSPLLVVGGFNYAQGGARVTIPADPKDAVKETARSVSEQISYFVTAHKKFNATDLVFLQGGANDLFAQLKSVAAGQLPPEQAVQNVGVAAAQFAALAKQLKSVGAVHLYVINLPMIESTPRVVALGPQIQGLVAMMIKTFNATLAGQLQGTDIQQLDIYTFDKTLNENYQQYGFKNIDKVACKSEVVGGWSLFCSANSLVEPGADLTYKFADPIHPSTGYSKAAGDFIYKKVTE